MTRSHPGGQHGHFPMSLRRSGAEPSCALRTPPGLRANDATAGLLAHRSSLQAVFPAPEGPSDLIGRQLLANSCGYSAGFTPASLLAPSYGGTICEHLMLQGGTSVNSCGRATLGGRPAAFNMTCQPLGSNSQKGLQQIKQWIGEFQLPLIGDERDAGAVIIDA